MPFVLAHDRAEALEPRTAERRILRKQEVAAPKALARHRPVRLPVDGEEDACSVARLRHALNEDENVPVRVGVDGAGTQSILGERHGIIIGVVVVRRGSPVA